VSIKVESISKFYGDQVALDAISFEINPGEIVGLLGPNGAGKSTLMKILSCYSGSNGGIASVCGYDTAKEPIEVKRNVGYLPEHTPLYLDMYIKEYLAFVAGLYSVQNKSERIKEMVELTGLGPEQHKKIGALSKGYRQRVGLAQALIHNPKVLILDEPTSGLDPNQLLEIRKLIKMTGEDKTIILSTHIMQEVTAICNRVLIINKGKIVADATSAELQNRISEENAVVVEFDKNISIEKILEVPGILHARQHDNLHWKILAEKDLDIRSNLFQFAVQNNLIILSMQKDVQSLEIIFQQLTLSK
jgi:ABC-2 type transport system ATP-binding protein